MWDHVRFIATNNQKVVGAFSVKHYAGPVEYSAVNFLEKNKDELPKETTELLMSSENAFLASLGQLLRDQTNQSFQVHLAQMPVIVLQGDVGFIGNLVL